MPEAPAEALRRPFEGGLGFNLGRAAYGAAWATLLLPLYLLATTAVAVLSAHEAAPYMDQWEMVAGYRDLLAHGFRFEDFWRQHNEHRLLFPRLVFLADYAFAGGSNRLNLAAIFLLQTAGGLFFVRAAVEGGWTPLKLAAVAVAVAALCSLSQWENFVWGFQVQFVGVYACAAWALHAFAHAGTPQGGLDRRSLALAFCLFGAAAFSMANGVFVGAAMFAMAGVGRMGWRAAATALIATALVGTTYFYGFHLVVGHSPPGYAFARPLEFACYVAVYLGAWLGQFGILPAQRLGFAGMALTAAMGLAVWLERGRSPARLALFGVATFVATSAVLTALGRLSFGLEQALSSRYLTPAAYFWAAQCVFWSAKFQQRSPGWLCAVLLAALAACGWLLVGAQAPSFTAVGKWRVQVASGADTLLTGAADRAGLDALHPEPATPLSLVPFLRRERLSIYAGPEAQWTGRRMGQVFRMAPREACAGAFDSWAPTFDGRAWRAMGWAWDRGADKRVKRVVLARRDGVVIGLGSGGAMRLDVPHAMPEVDNPNVGWNAVTRSEGDGAVAAYAVLGDGRACPIGTLQAPVSRAPRSGGAPAASARGRAPAAPGPA